MKVVSGLVCLLALAGCTLWGKDGETVTICGRGFSNDLDWSRASLVGSHCLAEKLLRIFRPDVHSIRAAKAMALLL